MDETSGTESLFDGASYKLAALRSSEERHAIALLDVAIQVVAPLIAVASLDSLVAAREAVLGRMVDLSRRLELQDEERDNALALAEAVRRVIA